MYDKVKTIAEAAQFMREHGIKNLREWAVFCEGGDRPADIPKDFGYFYTRYFPNEWKGTREFFGTAKKPYQPHPRVPRVPRVPGVPGVPRVPRVWRSFVEARAFIRTLELRDTEGWLRYCNSGQRPKDIPSTPGKVYPNEYQGMADWLNEKRWMTLEEASKAAIELGIKGHRKYCKMSKEGLLRPGMPSRPKDFYKEWKGWNHFLKVDNIIVNRKGAPISPKRARRLIRRKVKARSEQEYRKKVRLLLEEGKLPDGFPLNPQLIKGYPYKGMVHWLGLEKWPYHAARKYVLKLGIKNLTQWKEMVKDGKVLPNVAILDVEGYYRKRHQWVSMTDFFGDGFVDEVTEERERVKKADERLRKFERSLYYSFDEGRAIVHTLGIRTPAEWKQAYDDGRLPRDLPRCPDLIYAGCGWSGWKDWLGEIPIDHDSLKQRLETFTKMVYSPSESVVSKEAPEEWKDLGEVFEHEDYRGIFVSTHGRVFNSKKDKMLNQIRVGSKRWKGKCHLAVNFRRGKKGLDLIHRLVATAFIPNPENKPIVNHIDGKPDNNKIWNLEWVTARENNYHAILTGHKNIHSLSQEEAYEVKLMLATQKYTMPQICGAFGVKNIVVRQINLGCTYKYVGMGQFTYPIMPMKHNRSIDEETKKKVKELLGHGISGRKVSEMTGLAKNTITMIRDDYTPRVIPADSLKYMSESLKKMAAGH